MFNQFLKEVTYNQYKPLTVNQDSAYTLTDFLSATDWQQFIAQSFGTTLDVFKLRTTITENNIELLSDTRTAVEPILTLGVDATENLNMAQDKCEDVELVVGAKLNVPSWATIEKVYKESYLGLFLRVGTHVHEWKVASFEELMSTTNHDGIVQAFYHHLNQLIAYFRTLDTYSLEHKLKAMLKGESKLNLVNSTKAMHVKAFLSTKMELLKYDKYDNGIRVTNTNLLYGIRFKLKQNGRYHVLPVPLSIGFYYLEDSSKWDSLYWADNLHLCIVQGETYGVDFCRDFFKNIKSEAERKQLVQKHFIKLATVSEIENMNIGEIKELEEKICEYVLNFKENYVYKGVTNNKKHDYTHDFWCGTIDNGFVTETLLESLVGKYPIEEINALDIPSLYEKSLTDVSRVKKAYLTFNKDIAVAEFKKRLTKEELLQHISLSNPNPDYLAYLHYVERHRLEEGFFDETPSPIDFAFIASENTYLVPISDFYYEYKDLLEAKIKTFVSVEQNGEQLSTKDKRELTKLHKEVDVLDDFVYSLNRIVGSAYKRLYIIFED